MIINQKNLDQTTKLLWIFALIIGLGFGILLALFIFGYVLKDLSEGVYSQPGGIKDLLLSILYVIGPLLLVIFAIFRERVGGFLLIIGSLAFIIWFQIAIDSGKWVGFALGGPFLISGVLFLLSYYSHKSRN